MKIQTAIDQRGIIKKGMEEKQQAGQLLTEFLLQGPLYKQLELADNDISKKVVWLCEETDFQFDAYCTGCDRDSHFKRRLVNKQTYNGFLEGYNRLSTKETVAKFVCQRHDTHVYQFNIMRSRSALIKYGQMPSLEDIASSDIKRFRSVLESEYFSELHRANGLASHGIGIGSFVYLRRIFEKLIEDHRVLLEKAEAPIAGFDGMRMAEKIKALQRVLPPAIVEYKGSYGILSKGLHELSEEMCRKYFPAVRAAIIAILEQDLQEKERRKAEENLRIELNRIGSELSNEG